MNRPAYVNTLGTGYDYWNPIPLPVDPKSYTNKWGYVWWYMYALDEDMGVWGKVDEKGIDLATLHVMPYADFPDWEVK